MDSQSRHDDLEVEEILPTCKFANKGGALLIRCSSLEIIATIKENLHKKNLKSFEDSCFGHLLEMNPLCFQGPLLLHLLLHIDKAASKNNTLVFNINNSTMKFEATDFASITGLRLGTFEAAAAAASSRIHKDVFKGRASITFTDVEKEFLRACRDHRGGEVAFKLALLYFLYGVVLPESQRTVKVNMRYLHLADNLTLFRVFPWGRIGYNFLVSSFLSARLRLDGSSTARIYVPGFTFALQVWAYENMPSLALYCAKPVQSSTMRILNWSAHKSIRFDQLRQCFSLGVCDKVKVEPSTSTATHHTSVPRKKRRRAQSEDVVAVEPPAGPSRLSSDPISTNKSKGSSAETERQRLLLALAFDDNPALDTPPLWKTCSEFEICEAEYDRAKEFYEMLLERSKLLRLWISYAQFEAFARIQGSEIRDKRKRLERGRDVFARGESYFISCAPKMKEVRKMLLDQWFDMEYRFGEVGDVDSVRAKLPQKLQKRRRKQTEDGTTRFEVCVDYRFPEEKDV